MHALSTMWFWVVEHLKREFWDHKHRKQVKNDLPPLDIHVKLILAPSGYGPTSLFTTLAPCSSSTDSRDGGTSTVKFILLFLVGDFWKSTRHRYTPASSLRTFFTRNPDGTESWLKCAFDLKTSSSAQWIASRRPRPRASKLKRKREKKTKINDDTST
jgi:hypothetical protein